MPSDNRETHAQRRRIDAEVIAGIESEIEDCHQLSALKRAGELVFFSMIYLSGALWVSLMGKSVTLILPGIILMGVAMNSLGILIHEGLHGVLAKDRHMNWLLSFLCGIPLLISASAYRSTHYDHHVEFGRKLDFGTYRQHIDNKYFVWAAYYTQLFFGCIAYILIIPILAVRSASTKTRALILFEYLFIGSLVTTAFLALPAQSLLLYWIYPSVVMMALTNVRGLASHALGDLEDIYLSSRSVRSPRWIEVLFLHENYHLEHHLFPQVPSYNLKRAHQLVWNRLPRALEARSYLDFLARFLKASFTLDLKPCGLVHPQGELASASADHHE